MLNFHESKRAVFTASLARVQNNIIHHDAIGLGKKAQHQLQPFIENYKYSITD
jgi:hypothetical protein